MYACVYAPGSAPASVLAEIAQQFSPRYETRGDLVVVDVRGLDRLFGDARAIGEEIRREAADRGVRVHVAIAGTQTAAVVLAIARPGVVVVERGNEAEAIAPVSLQILGGPALLPGPADGDPDRLRQGSGESRRSEAEAERVALHIEILKRWGLKTLGEIAALPADELSSRMGQQGLTWHAIARGVDVRPLVPDVEDERFEASLELEWPIEGLEPLSFVLTRLLEPLSLRLEQRDRGVAVLHVQLRLVNKDTYARRLELPTPMRDVKTLRTLALLDLEAHPPAENTIGIDRVTVVIDPTPGRVWQHTLFARPHPTPEQLSTLLARLGAAMGQDRIGAPVLVDTYRPGAFAMAPFATVHDDHRATGRTGRTGGMGRMVEHAEPPRPPHPALPAYPAPPAFGVAVRRCRQPVPAVVAVNDSGAPIKVITHRRGFAGGAVLRATGPWKTSGDWWADGWDRDEWDVALSDGASYRVFLDRASGGWFIDAILD
jgi:protein ImuB